MSKIKIIETSRISILLGKEKKLSVRGCKWFWEKSRKVDNDIILFHQLEYVVMVRMYNTMLLHEGHYNI